MTTEAGFLNTPESQQAAINQKQAIAEKAQVGAIRSNQFTYFAAFDGTNNSYEPTNGDLQNTNVAQLFHQADLASKTNTNIRAGYKPGPGTEGTLTASSWLSPQVTRQVIIAADEMYQDFAFQASDWLRDNPDGDVTVALTAFSRGSPSAAVFSQMLYSRGLVDPANEAVLIAPGQIGVSAGVLFDPVGTSVDGNMAFVNVSNMLVLSANNEYRDLFKAEDYSGSPGINIFDAIGNHCDVGGCYDNGLGAIYLEGSTDYFQLSGLAIADVDTARQHDPTARLVVHDESVTVDAYGNVTRHWDSYGSYTTGAATQPERRFDSSPVKSETVTYGSDSMTKSFELYNGSKLNIVTPYATPDSAIYTVQADFGDKALDISMMLNSDGDYVVTAINSYGGASHTNNTALTNLLNDIGGFSPYFFAADGDYGTGSDPGYTAAYQDTKALLGAYGSVAGQVGNNAQLAWDGNTLRADNNRDGKWDVINVLRGNQTIAATNASITLAAGATGVVINGDGNTISLANGSSVTTTGSATLNYGGKTQQIIGTNTVSFTAQGGLVMKDSTGTTYYDANRDGQWDKSVSSTGKTLILDGNLAAAQAAGKSLGANQFFIGGQYNTVEKAAAALGLQAWQLRAANPGLNDSQLIGKVAQQPTVRNGLMHFNSIGMFNTYNMQTGEFLPSTGNINTSNLLNLENQYSLLNRQNLLDGSFYKSFTNFTTNYLVTTGGAGINLGNPSIGTGIKLDPIGAFYESVSPANDNAASIATKTPVLFGSGNRGLTPSQLAAQDGNLDGKLNGTELTGLQAWADTNENGLLDDGELRTISQSGISTIRAADYGFYTRGNGQPGTGPVTAPVKGNESAGNPVKPVYATTTPASNFRSLRDTDNNYAWNNGRGISFINWSASQIKINQRSPSYLIGTDGNDRFDANYFSANNNKPFNLSLLVNFLAGGGNDVMGGSSRSDNLWGGTGNDVLLGYEGNDNLYGEEGEDELQGGNGGDLLNGGAGNDNLFGQVGNDVLIGGDGNDMLMGFTANNEAKQSLAAGETDNDTLLGGAGTDSLFGGLGDDTLDGGDDADFLSGQSGNDTLFGGNANDELQGGDGNDKLLGEAGNDKLFGQTGDDILWGGDGDDVLLGFTASNELKQTLNLGETDNDTLYGGRGNDNLYGGLGNDYIDGGDDNDLVSGLEGDDLLFGGAGNDELQGGFGNDQLMGETGNDKLFGQVGNDVLWGGAGNDILVGFTASNELKQRLSTGETDNDILYGGDGNDFILGNLGDDNLYGDAGIDELQGGDGNDRLYGGADNDRLFGQAGNDVLYGGDGDDILIGFTGKNESKQTLNYAESDDDWLYGGAGNDILFSGLGNDYLDGGAGADFMEGGQGNDTYIVNSVNDTILERQNEGYDTVISSTNYILNMGIEELRLLEGYDIHGTGNALNNIIIGNSGNNILDGVTGADTMIGGLGDDTYYVDHTADSILENLGEGTDTVQSSISHTLGENLENLILLDFSKPEKGLVDGQGSLVYGYPKRNELDYMQGDAIPDYQGTCALTAIANLLTQSDRPTSEADVVQVAIDNNWAITNPALPPYQRGGSNYIGQQALLDNYGVRNKLLTGYNEEGVANLIRGGRGVILAVNAGLLWNDPAHVGNGSVNHVITITGAVFSESKAELIGFYITDSGRSKVSDMTRYIDIDTFRSVANVPSAYAIYTIEPLKLWDENIDGIGNVLNNVLVGNRGDNVLIGGDGNDILEGGAGSDTLNGGSGNDALDGGLGNDSLIGGLGDDVYRIAANAGHDVIMENDSNAGNKDTLLFAAGIDPADVTISRNGQDLRLVMDNGSVTVKEWFTNNGSKVEQITFADGTVWSISTIRAALGMNSAPTASARTITIAEDTRLVFKVDDFGFTDADEGDTLQKVSIVSLPGAGQLLLNGVAVGVDQLIQGADIASGKLTFTPANNANGLNYASFDFRISDGATLSLSGYTLTLDVTAVNDRPTGAPVASLGTGTEDTPYIVTSASLLAGFSDPDGQALSIVGLRASNGTLSAFNTNNNSWIYTPAANFNGTVNLSYGVSDGIDTVSATQSFKLNAVNDAVTGRVSITGSTVLGQTLTASLTNLKDADGMGTPSFQWLRGTTAINGATSSTYKLTSSDMGSRIGVRVSYLDGGGSSETSSSAALTVVSNINSKVGTGISNSLTGTSGNDLLDGKAGNDTLNGGRGNDTYLMSRGYGTDTIIDSDSTLGNFDILRFDSDIASDQLWFRRHGNNLEVSVVGTSDKAVISNWYSGTANRMEQIVAGNGLVLTDTKVDALVQAMAAFAPPAAGQTTLSTEQQAALAPVLAANWQ